MKVILLEDVKKLGTKGQVVQVADGYARNYLIPRGLAKEGSTGNLKNLALEQQRQSQQQEKQHLAMVAKAARLNGTRLEIKARTGDGGKLFGSVTSKDVAEALRAATGEDVDRRRIALDEPIKALGSYPIEIKLYPGVSSQITVDIVAEQ
ncbi:MAG TPA: 50S ribosomal protein L9 [Firmicutes bacterium]|nr:50S ribosomal protein L9 [Bacillota bacterium]